MDNFRGTKGKWLLNDTLDDIFGGNDNYNHISAGIGNYNCNQNRQSGFNLTGYISKEDALLISKAPEMLELLLEVSEFLDRVQSPATASRTLRREINQLITEATTLP